MSLSPNNNQQDLENQTTTEQVAEVPAAEGEGDQGELLLQLEEKTQEAKENYERILRLAAELENLKKRQEKERTDLVMYANESIIKELLPVVDSLEMALSHGRQQENPPALMEGIENVLKGFQAALAKFGVSPINARGEKFDPAFHNAVMQQESSEAEDQTIIQELQKGYLLNNRLLRPTMVVVARKPSTESVRINVKI
jgi:molecular chaperone GrpE